MSRKPQSEVSESRTTAQQQNSVLVDEWGSEFLTLDQRLDIIADTLVTIVERSLQADPRP